MAKVMVFSERTVGDAMDIGWVGAGGDSDAQPRGAGRGDPVFERTRGGRRGARARLHVDVDAVQPDLDAAALRILAREDDQRAAGKQLAAHARERAPTVTDGAHYCTEFRAARGDGAGVRRRRNA
jgi:hypothetical protein